MKKILILLYFFPLTVSAQSKTAFLKNLLWDHASPQLKMILQHPDSFRYQVIYTRIDRDKFNQPHFTNYYYNVDRNIYFNPASTVKMPLSFLALEKINHLKKYGVNKYTTMLIDSSYEAQSAVSQDTSAENNLPSIAQYIRKIFLVSDNDAYNRLYEFLGQQYINERLWQMGYKDIRITRRFVPMNDDQNRHTNQIRFTENNHILYTQPPAFNEHPFDFSKKILIGKAHFNSKDSLIQSPMDFTTHNNISLEDLQQILKSVLFPQSVSPKKRFDLSEDDYKFLYQYMSEYPSESTHPRYDTATYFDSYAKFFMFKSGKSKIPSYIRIFNKPGWSYGFLTDVAYIVDFKNNIEFMTSAVIYVNSDGILNDDKYEYDETGYPFFKEIGDIMYQYELKRKRQYTPDLKKLKIHYQ
ncbi:MAG: serine hydrolase [Bacteroidetes bacterium]|nr:serine hydrolase [Bacteroidota bacterium]